MRAIIKKGGTDPQKIDFIASKPASVQHRLSKIDLFWTAMKMNLLCEFRFRVVEGVPQHME
jgi:hypothetical protein